MPASAKAIISTLPEKTQAVGLFVNRPPAEVIQVSDALNLRLVQLHGDEPAEDLVALDRFWIIKAFRLGSAADLQAMNDFLERAGVLGRLPDAVLVDAHVPGQAGGTGTMVAEDLLSLAPRGCPPDPRRRTYGGNVAQRVALVRPWMVDVASGVESAPGRKDLEKVAAFIRAAKTAATA